MGCDIHLYVEVKNSAGIWNSADNWSVPDWVEDGEDHCLDVEYGERFYEGRNYDLFSMLANVRNGYGFAGCKTGDGINPISDPKGMPEDASPLVLEAYNWWGCDAHSASYLTLKELLDYDWTQGVVKNGVLHGYEFYKWDTKWRRDEGEPPESYSGEIWGKSLVEVDEERLRIIISDLMDSSFYTSLDTYSLKDSYLKKELNKYMVSCEWGEPYYQRAARFLSHTMPKLWRLGNPEDVRIVFWFDN